MSRRNEYAYNNANHSDAFSVSASPQLQSRACWPALVSEIVNPASSNKQMIKYQNKIRNWCTWILAGKTKDNLRRLKKEYGSKNREIVTEIICEVFDLSRNEFLSGQRNGKANFDPTPEWERLQRRGFDDGAKVPGSTNIRKVSR